jgi:hypothetical protein
MPTLSQDNLIRIAAIILAVAFVTALWFKARRTNDRNSPRDVLLHMCLGDKSQAKRLIALERSRSPGISRREATVRAIDSLRRDSSALPAPPRA